MHETKTEGRKEKTSSSSSPFSRGDLGEAQGAPQSAKIDSDSADRPIP